MPRETEQFWNSQLENATVVPEFAAWQDRHEALSAMADALGRPERIATGPDDSQVVWRTNLGRRTHGLVFVHGGYWRRYAAEHFTFVAETAAAADCTFFNIDYRLMPAVRMADVVADVVAGIEIAMSMCERVVLVGQSAGAHLAVEAATRLGKRPDHIVAISGLYDLSPLPHSFIQDEIGLTRDEVLRFSPLLKAGDVPCPLHLRAGASETVEFRRQSARMFEVVRECGGEATIEFLDQHHHASIIADLADTRSVLSQLVQNLLA